MRPAVTIAIEQRIHTLRKQRVMLSSDLAHLYGVAPKALVQAVKRNQSRFPPDFMFQLTSGEYTNLKSQFVTSSLSHGGLRRALPYAFTEHGVAMLSSVLRSERAVQVNIEIVRAFIRLKQWAVSVADLTARLDTLEQKYDRHFKVVFDAIRELMTPSQKRIGF